MGDGILSRLSKLFGLKTPKSVEPETDELQNLADAYRAEAPDVKEILTTDESYEIQEEANALTPE